MYSKNFRIIENEMLFDILYQKNWNFDRDDSFEFGR